MITKPQVQFTLERFYPEFIGRYGVALLQRHVNRYKWAMSKLKSDYAVLDAGCGCGYFDFSLLDACKTVHGIDISEQAIQYAKWKAMRHNQPRLTYEVMDLANITTDLKFDAVVCIEAIEHLLMEDQGIFMGSLKNILKPDGSLLITTPKKGKATGTYHQHEFENYEFVEFLGSFFYRVDFDIPLKYKVPENFMMAHCRGIK